jgi:hypothetical protein
MIIKLARGINKNPNERPPQLSARHPRNIPDIMELYILSDFTDRMKNKNVINTQNTPIVSLSKNPAMVLCI